MQPNEIFMISFVVQGALVMLSYCAYFPDDNLWAGLNDPCVFYIWCVTASLSAIGFCSFSVELMYYPEYYKPEYMAAVLPYSIFLTSASLYMPLAVSNQKFWTLASLFVAALSSCALFYVSVMLFGWSWVTWLVGVLAFHCTVIDLIFWGFTWTHVPTPLDYEV